MPVDVRSRTIRPSAGSPSGTCHSGGARSCSSGARSSPSRAALGLGRDERAGGARIGSVPGAEEPGWVIFDGWDGFRSAGDPTDSWYDAALDWDRSLGRLLQPGEALHVPFTGG
jgi:hypothetical protein